jgi:hypothetical protein
LPGAPIGVTLRGMRTAALALLLGFSSLSGCTDKTSLIVEVASPDLIVPRDVDALRFEAVTPDGWRVEESFDITEPWPHSLAILPGPANTSSEVLVSVTGLTNGDFAVRRTAVTRFIAGQTNRVVLQLTLSCLGVECDPGIDCVAGMCTDVVVPPDGGTDSSLPDGGMDSSVMDSSMPDSTMDSSVPDSTMMDSSTPDTMSDACTTGPEVCGGGDEDCDMMVDEGLPCPGTLVISEVATGGPSGGLDEFVEIYNRADYPIDISGLEIEYQSSAGTSWSNRTTFPAGSTIGAHGLYLAGGSSYSRSTSLDPGSSWSSGMNRLGGHVRIANGATELDRFGWGTAMSPEGNAMPQVVDDAVNTYERKAGPTSSASSMTTGADVSRGNGHDTDDNRADFVERPSGDPQNTTSPAESP